MKTTLKTILTLAAVTSALPLLSFAQSKGIYGDDNRMDFFAASADLQALADSVVSLWGTEKAVLNPGSKVFTLKTMNFGSDLNLCPDEKFRGQRGGAFCSGALMAADIVMTAGHCVQDEAECAGTKVVFGYAVKERGGTAPVKIAQEEVYGCAKILQLSRGDSDYALIQLDRPVAGHKALAVNRASTLEKGDGVFVIGHPKGLPLKVTDGATVRDAAPAGYFVTDLDSFNGNSGSPVFNAKTGLVEGILVRGGEDFAQSPTGCTSSAVYPQNGGRGEDVTKISGLQAFIPKLAAEKEAEAVEKANTIKSVDTADIKALWGIDVYKSFQ